MSVPRYLLALVLGIVLPYAVQRWDRRRLPRDRREGAWNAASWGSALYGFGPLSMIAWLWVTRHDFWAWQRRDGLLVALLRSAALLVAGALAAAAISGVVFGVDELVGALSGAPD